MDFGLTAFALLGYYDVRKDFKRVKEGSLNDSSESVDKVASEGYPADLKKRLSWVLTLLVSLRLGNYLIGDSSHDQKQLKVARHRPTYYRYFLETVFMATCTFATLDIISMYTSNFSSNEFFKLRNEMYEQGGRFQFSALVVFLGELWAALSLYTFYLPSLLAFILLSPFPSLYHSSSISPLSLSNHFGPTSSIWNPTESSPIWGLRAFWGRFWHQNMRIMTTTPGLALTDMFSVPKRSFLRYVIMLISGFFWSGIIHMGMIPPEPFGTPYTAWQLRIRIAAFFWLQTMGIGVEVFIDHMLTDKPRESHTVRANFVPTKEKYGNAAPRTQPQPRRRLGILGKSLIIVWTLSFIGITAWHTIRPVGRELGWWSVSGAPISVVAWLRGDQDWHRQWF